MSQRHRDSRRAQKVRSGWVQQSRTITDQIAEKLKEAEQVEPEPDEPELSYAESLKLWNEQVRAGQAKPHERQD